MKIRLYLTFANLFYPRTSPTRGSTMVDATTKVDFSLARFGIKSVVSRASSIDMILPQIHATLLTKARSPYVNPFYNALYVAHLLHVHNRIRTVLAGAQMEKYCEIILV